MAARRSGARRRGRRDYRSRAGGLLTAWTAFGWTLAAFGLGWLLTFDFAGSAPTSAAGLFEERDFRVVLDLDRCVGAYT
jgi:hypothetical protein